MRVVFLGLWKSRECLLSTSCGRGRSEQFSGPLLIRSLILLKEGPTLMTSFNLDYFLRGSLSKHSHREGVYAELQYMNLVGRERGTFSPKN